MRLRHSRLFLAFLLIVCLQLPSPALLAAAKGGKGKDKPTGAKIQGKIRDADGKPIGAGYRVRLKHLRSTASFESADTGSSGEYRIDGLPYGYFELRIVAPDGEFRAEQVVNVPPSSKVVVNLMLVRFDERSQEWRDARERAGAQDAGATGIAELAIKRRGRDFWRSNKGVVIIAGLGTGVLLAIAAGDDETQASGF